MDLAFQRIRKVKAIWIGSGTCIEAQLRNSLNYCRNFQAIALMSMSSFGLDISAAGAAAGLS